MTATPWGDSEHLRRYQLSPGPTVDKRAVEQNQKERLYGATVAVMAAKGYGPTTVADLTTLAGVSRTTFYKYFADKEACFLATLQAIVDAVLAITRSRLRIDADWRTRAETALGAFIELLVAQPDAARLCVVEAEAAGGKALAIVDAAVEDFTAILATVFDELPNQHGMPPEIAAAMIGGVRKILHTRLHRRTEHELLELVPGLISLALSYEPPPGPLPEQRPRGSRSSKPDSHHRPGIDEPAERIELAALAVCARAGFANASMAAIAAEAGASLRTLYSSFPDKTEVIDAALLRCRLRLATAALPAYRRGQTWPASIAGAIAAGLAYLEAEPDFAKVITIDVHGAGSDALERRDRALESAAGLIEAAPNYKDLQNPVAAEALTGALYSLLSNRLRSPQARDLRGLTPLATYLILAPFIGMQQAYNSSVSIPPKAEIP